MQENDAWQPDWSQAPEWATAHSVDGGYQAMWHEKTPILELQDNGWLATGRVAADRNFRVQRDKINVYTNAWPRSLRMRPPTISA